MKRTIKIIITTKVCDRKNVVIGYFNNGCLHISLSKLPEIIYIISDTQFSANEGELCLEQLREKLDNCEDVMRYASAIIYYNTAFNNCVSGAAQNEYDELGRPFVKIDYFIEYSLYDLI